jgi:hypothetical protein
VRRNQNIQPPDIAKIKKVTQANPIDHAAIRHSHRKDGKFTVLPHNSTLKSILVKVLFYSIMQGIPSQRPGTRAMGISWFSWFLGFSH